MRETHVLAELEDSSRTRVRARVFKGGQSEKRADAVVAPTGGVKLRRRAVVQIGSGASITRRRPSSSTLDARWLLRC